MKFFIKDLVTFTEVILNGNLHFLSSGNHSDAAERDCLGKKNCEKFHKTHKKTTLPESLLIKLQATNLELYQRRLQHSCFSVNLVKIFRTPYL